VFALMQEFNAVAALDDTKPAELLKLAEQYVDAYQLAYAPNVVTL
jgi:hypothetical protein